MSDQGTQLPEAPLTDAHKRSPALSFLFVLTTGFVAGLGAYQTALHLTDRTVVSSQELLKAAKHVDVIFSGTDNRPGGCGDIPQSTYVVEVWTLKSNHEPADFVLMSLDRNKAYQDTTKINNILKVTDSGWQVTYCGAPGGSDEGYRRFINPRTGESSELMKYRNQY